jgi:hypothetical protein
MLLLFLLLGFIVTAFPLPDVPYLYGPYRGHRAAFLNLCALGLPLLFVGFIMERRKDNLKAQGDKIRARVVDVEYGYDEGDKYMELICEYVDPVQNRHIFKSKRLWCYSLFQPASKLKKEDVIGMEVDVYIKKGNYEKYVVDESGVYN